MKSNRTFLKSTNIIPMTLPAPSTFGTCGKAALELLSNRRREQYSMMELSKNRVGRIAGRS
jgi:hypothetical protein